MIVMVYPFRTSVTVTTLQTYCKHQPQGPERGQHSPWGSLNYLVKIVESNWVSRTHKIVTVRTISTGM